MSTEKDYANLILMAWQGNIELPELVEHTARLEAEKLGPLSAVLYQVWLARTSSPYAHAIYFNLGVTLSNEGDLNEAEQAYRKAIDIQPMFAQPRLNLGSLYERQGQIEAALEEWIWVAENISPEQPDSLPLVLHAMNHLGRVLESEKRFQEAETWLTRSLAIDPTQADVMQHWVHLRQKQCAWPVYTQLEGITQEFMRQSTSALAMLGISDDPEYQLEIARRFVNRKVQPQAPLAELKRYQHPKIRVGYCSSDFCLHPVSMLTVELFELHDRERFEVYGYCWSPEDGSGLRQRVIKAMDHFVRIAGMTDEQAAQLIRGDEIDILIDLQGLTAGARPNLLAYKPAPIQIAYLGLPATTGMPSIDYIIADRYLIPEESARYYSEKPLYMPDVYQICDRKRVAADKPSREQCGLPEEGFVFCSFNNNFKFTPEVFDAWMNILQRVPGSLLWLLSDNPWAEANLRKAAETRGLAKERLIFAPRVLPEQYLARYQAADLFLDTFPFNAGTTANDALWMGLPVLTYSGRAFAARMAGSLLKSVKLEELITTNLKDYEEKAVWLATHPEHCRQLRTHLLEERENGVLFDTPLFVRSLESRFKQLVAGLGREAYL